MGNSRSLTGKKALVTGGTSGIGFYTARSLAEKGAVVYITGRDVRRGEESAIQIQDYAGNEGVRFIRADSSTVGGNQQLADQILAETGQLHILVNNVGGLYNDRWETEDGYEATLAMNLIGPFALTEALLPALQAGGPARIVNVTSASFLMWKGDPFADPQSCETYSGFHAYNRSKYLNVLWTLAFAHRFEGSGIAANALHPGTAWTGMTQKNEPRVLPIILRWLWPVFRLMQKRGSPEKASSTSIFLASAPEARNLSGQYFESSTRPKKLPGAVLDPANQDKTWKFAEALVRSAPTAVKTGIVENRFSFG